MAGNFLTEEMLCEYPKSGLPCVERGFHTAGGRAVTSSYTTPCH